MEQVYRRRQDYGRTRRRQAEAGGVRYKQGIIKQSAVCLLLFIGARGVKLSSQPGMEPVKSAINRIITEQTDFSKLPEQLYGFLETHILHRESPENLAGKEALLHMTAPVEAGVTSGFGLRNHPLDGGEKFHYGVDLGAGAGEDIRAAEAGEAVEVGVDASYGNYILLRHGDSIYTLYTHCESLLTAQGDVVQKGQVIATVGETGGATGPHLHFEIRDEDTWLDPAEFITFRQEISYD